MVEDRVERRHAAILAADVAGCSRLMGVNQRKLPPTVIGVKIEIGPFAKLREKFIDDIHVHNPA